jgi:hypothetical protein
VWLRFYDSEGRQVPTQAEATEQRVVAAEAELARLKEQLAQLQRGQRPGDGASH